MAQFGTLPNGQIDDRVRIVMNENDVRIFESYEMRQSYMQAPASFACRLGSGEVTRQITGRYPPGTRYQATIGPVVQQSGRTDGYAPEGSQGATEVNIRGRDTLAPLHDDMVTADRSFGNASYIELVTEVLIACGVDQFTIIGDNAANRSARANATITKVTIEPLASYISGTQSAITAGGAAAVSAGPAGAGILGSATALIPGVPKYTTKPNPDAKPLQAKVGQRWWDFLKKELDRAGLFLFAAGEPAVFMLCQPDTKQTPLYQLIRQRNAPVNTVTVLSARHTNDTLRRASHYIVHGRGGKGYRKAINAKIGASFVDEEMVNLGFTRHKVVADPQANNDKRAAYLCKRIAAEDRRQSWTLTYTVKGHTTIGLTGQDRLVWAVDTLVTVRDDELGIYGDLWIESLAFRCDANGGTTTEITMIRPSDLIFGDPDLLA